MDEISVYVTRHARSCNNSAGYTEKFLEPLLTGYGVDSGISRSLLQKVNEDGSTSGEFLYSSDIVYVSCLVRTWLTALILYNANMTDPKELFTLRVIPGLKEKHVVKKGNYPLELRVSLSLFLMFLNNLNTPAAGEGAGEAGAGRRAPAAGAETEGGATTFEGLIASLPENIKIEIYTDPRNEPLQITFVKNRGRSDKLYSQACETIHNALFHYASDPLTGYPGHTNVGDIKQTAIELASGRYGARGPDIHVVSHSAIMRKCLRDHFQMEYDIKRIDQLVDVGSEVHPETAIGHVTLYTPLSNRPKKTNPYSSPTSPSLNQIKHLKHQNMFSIEFKSQSHGIVGLPESQLHSELESEPGPEHEPGPEPTLILSKIYDGIPFKGDKGQDYSLSVSNGLCIDTGTQDYKTINCGDTGEYRASLKVENIFFPNQEIPVKVYVDSKAVFAINDKGAEVSRINHDDIERVGPMKKDLKRGGVLEGNFPIAQFDRRSSPSPRILPYSTVRIDGNGDQKMKLIFNGTNIRYFNNFIRKLDHYGNKYTMPSRLGGGKRKSERKSKRKLKRKSKRKSKRKYKRKTKRKTRKR